jgi:glycosyltransferase involved in cell wall biosynthesis
MASIDMSGGARVCAIYAQKLQACGHHVRVIAPKKRLLSFKQQSKNLLKNIAWQSVGEQLKNHFDLMQVNVTYLESKHEMIADNIPDADVIIATWWETVEWIVPLPNSKGVKVYFIQGHEVFSWLPVDRVMQTYRLPLYKITVSNWLRSLMQVNYHSSSVFLVPNSVNTELFFAPLRKKQKRPTLGFLYSGCVFKRVEVALKVIEKIKMRLPELRVLCFGSQKPNKTWPLEDYFEFEYNPKQDNIRNIYAQCDVWLCCSESEGFGLPILEAMACCCPAVSTKCGGPEDIIQHGKNGFLCEVDDIEALTATVIKVLNLPEQEWQILSKNALETTTAYNWDHATDLFENALIQCVKDFSNQNSCPI